MEPEGSIPCSQEPPTLLYTETDSSGLCKIYFTLFYHLCLLLSNSLLSPGFPAASLHAFLFCTMRATHSAYPTLLDFIIIMTSDDEYKSWRISVCNFFNLSVTRLLCWIILSSILLVWTRSVINHFTRRQVIIISLLAHIITRRMQDVSSFWTSNFVTSH
jgi:hypothetical protein